MAVHDETNDLYYELDRGGASITDGKEYRAKFKTVDTSITKQRSTEHMEQVQASLRDFRYSDLRTLDMVVPLFGKIARKLGGKSFKLGDNCISFACWLTFQRDNKINWLPRRWKRFILGEV